MTDQPDPGTIRELKDLRADVAGRPPGELHRARGRLLAEIQAERGIADSPHPAYPPRGASRPPAARWHRPVALGCRRDRRRGGRGPRRQPAAGASRPPAAPARASAPSRASGPAVLTAAYVLNHAASAAAASSRPVPRPGQFIYVTSVTTYVSTEIGPSGEKSWLYKTSRQIWQSVDGQRAGLLQIVERGNVKLPWGPVPPADSGNPVDWTPLPASSCPGAAPARSTYAFLASLPTDPGRLRTWLYQHRERPEPA